MSRNRLPAGWAIAATGAIIAHSAIAMVLMRPVRPAEAPPPALIIEIVAAPPAPQSPGFAVPDSGLPTAEPPVTRPEWPEPEPAPLGPEPPEKLSPPVVAPPPDPVNLPELPSLAPHNPKQFENVAVPLTRPPLEVEPSEELVLTTSARPQRKPDPPRLHEEPRQAQGDAQRERPRREAPRQAASQQHAAPPASGAAGQEPSSGQTATPDPGAGRATSRRAMQTWESQVRQAVARHMSRTRVSTRQGLSATVAVRVDGAGRVAGVSLAGSSGDARVDAALSTQARRLPRLPATPDGRARDLVVPFRITR